jgi:hypothetical protein
MLEQIGPSVIILGPISHFSLKWTYRLCAGSMSAILS